MYIPEEYREFISCAVLLHGAPVDVEGVIGDPRLFTVSPCLLHFRFVPPQLIDHFRLYLLECTIISLRHFWPLASHSITVLKECKFGHGGTHVSPNWLRRCTMYTFEAHGLNGFTADFQRLYQVLPKFSLRYCWWLVTGRGVFLDPGKK